MLGRILLAGGALSLTSVCLYARYLYSSLSSQIKNTQISAQARKARYVAGEIRCLPSDLVEHPEDFRIIHVQDERSVQLQLPESEHEAVKLFTNLLRRNMRIFSRTPQAWMMRMMTKTPEQIQSYSTEYIESLNYEEGDLFCGFNRVLRREPLKIEVELVPPEGMHFNGRLVIGLMLRGTEVLLRTQTLQWTRSDDEMVLPLERSLASFLHETASWYLIVSGLDYLKTITETSEKSL